MKIVYSDRYQLNLGAHVFPTVKYLRVRQRLLDSRTAEPADFLDPPAATWDDLALVHTADYLEKLQRGRLSLEEIAQMEIPWSHDNVEGFRLMTGGTLFAARLALSSVEQGSQPPRVAEGTALPRGHAEARADLERAETGSPADSNPPVGQGLSPANPNPPVGQGFSPTTVSPARRWSVVVHLGGGFHHAFCTHGEGFCMFNDVAVAIRRLKRDGAVARAAIVDCDVHDGNGTAAIFTGEPSVFTFSMHQLHNYPAFKPPGSLDIALDDQTTDEEYLNELREALPRVFRSRPQVLFYLAGADPYEDDQLGGLRLSKNGLRQRDRTVLEAAHAACVPVVVTLAGGYARHPEDTVDIHVATVEEARAVLDTASAGEAPSEC